MYTSLFFNSVKGDRKYKAEAFAEYFASFIGNGVFPVSGNTSSLATHLQVRESSGMTVTVAAGKAWINGYLLHNFDDTAVILATATGVLDRIDRIVLRWSLADRAIDIAVKQGTYSSNPEPETLRRDDDIYELALADVYVTKGTLTIKQANITDLRLNADMCGIVVQTVREIDFTVFFEQYNAQFYEWFDFIKDILDESTAKHLLDMINAKADDTLANVSDDDFGEKAKSAGLGGDIPNHYFTDLDDVQMRCGIISNAGTGWQGYKFKRPVDGVPAVTLTLENYDGFVQIRNVTASGFEYQVRKLDTVTNRYVSSASATWTGVSQTIANGGWTAVPDAVKIHYIAVYGGE